MVKRHITNITETNLEHHKDDRGSIIDLFYNTNINHVAVIKSEPNVIRGNHYHKETTQHMLMTKGSLEYLTLIPSKVSMNTILGCTSEINSLIELSSGALCLQ